MARAKPITGLDSQAATGVNARIIARIRLEELYSWSQYVDNPYNVRELHNMRIAAKRLRYTFEVFEEVLPEASRAIVKELTHIQDELGALHDSDVMIALLRLCLGSQDSGAAYEEALLQFVRSALEPRDSNLFLGDFVDFQRRVRRFGLLNGLSQTLLICARSLESDVEISLLANFLYVGRPHRVAG